MQRSTDRILTTHTGSLPRPTDVLEAMRARESGQAFDQAAFEARVREAVADNVRREVEAGLDVVNDGEVGKPSFGGYVAERLGGFETRPAAQAGGRRLGPIHLDGRDAQQFPDYYAYVVSHSPFENTIRMAPRVCVAPLSYTGQALVQRDIANLKAALSDKQVAEAFLPSASPINMTTGNEYYRSSEEFGTAYADAMREEYRQILDAGLLLQIDDPSMVEDWDGLADMTLDDYRRRAEQRVEILNYALRDLP